MQKFELENLVNFFIGIQSQEADVSNILGLIPNNVLLRRLEEWQTPFYLHVKNGTLGQIEIELDMEVDETDTHYQLCQDLVLQGVLESSVVKDHRITIEWVNDQPDMLMVDRMILPKALIDKLTEVGISIQSCTIRFAHRPIIRFRVDQLDKRLVGLISGWVDTIRNHQSHSATGCWRTFTNNLGEDTDGIGYPWHQWLGMESVAVHFDRRMYFQSRVFDQDGFFRTVVIHPRYLGDAGPRP